jgi:hypothetical protein
MPSSVTEDKIGRMKKKKMPAPRAKLLAREGLGEPPLAKPVYITMYELAQRWRCTPESIKYYRKIGLIHPHFLSPRRFKYRLAEIEAIEREAALAAEAKA